MYYSSFVKRFDPLNSCHTVALLRYAHIEIVRPKKQQTGLIRHLLYSSGCGRITECFSYCRFQSFHLVGFM